MPDRTSTNDELFLTAIAAVARNGVIGRGGTLPWHLPEDLRHFKRTTRGRVCLMGRKTFDSIVADLGGPLPSRTSVVLTRSGGFARDHAGDGRVRVVHRVEELLTVAAALAGGEAASPDRGPCLIGGAELYRLLLPRCRRLVLTEVDAEVLGDAVFPELDPAEWAETARRVIPADAENPIGCTIRVLDRAFGAR